MLLYIGAAIIHQYLLISNKKQGRKFGFCGMMFGKSCPSLGSSFTTHVVISRSVYDTSRHLQSPDIVVMLS